MKNETKIKGIVDRLEDGIAVILIGGDEDAMIELPLCYLPPDTQEGDIITFKASVNSRKTKEAKNKVEKMLKKLSH